ncbi:Protein MAM3 [Diplonema papillatum]|nr:Protein MAM3 [Diplonema papillatum]
MLEHGRVVGLCLLLGCWAAGVSAAAPDSDAPDTTMPCECPAPEEEEGSGIPLPLALAAALGLLCLSGIFSGLTLGLLGLDTMALKAIAEAGSSPTREYAQRIMPLREDGNLLLCTLLLGNVMVNVMIPILLADITGGLLGFIASTVFIVIFGEIVPQATCSMHALYIGSKSIPLVSFFMFILYIFAKPIAMVLDRVLGTDAGQIYDKSELKQLLWQHLHEDRLVQSEFKMISRALDLQKTEVESIMTPEDKTYKLDINEMLTEERLTEIWQTGHSRIPITENVVDPETQIGKESYVGIMYTKDLITVRIEDKITVKQILGFYNRGLPLMLDRSNKLDKVLDLFRQGKSHIALVTDTFSQGSGDPTVEVVGIVTLEDVIEQLVGEEIIDEHDNYEDIGAVRRKKTGRPTMVPLGVIRNSKNRFTYDQARSIVKYLQYTVSDPLAALDEEQLLHLVMTSGIKELRLPVTDVPRSLDSPSNVWVYRKGEPTEYFTLILQGRLETIFGSERFRSEYTSNQFIGTRVLKEGSSVLADFDCRVVESPSRVLQFTYRDLEKARAYKPDSSDRDGSNNTSFSNHNDHQNPLSNGNNSPANNMEQAVSTPLSPPLRYSPPVTSLQVD